jgi:hypothetical protein
MNVQGTLNRPSTHDPSSRHLPKQDPSMKTFAVTLRARRRAATYVARQKRTRDMQLMPETLARAQMDTRLYEAESERRAHRVVTARRLTRRAERASLRARRALAMAVMQ